MKSRHRSRIGSGTGFSRQARAWSATVGEADVVLPLDATQAGRLIASREDCEHTFHDQVPAYGLIRSKRFAKSFARFGWQIVAHAGDFLLITNPR